MTKIEFIQSYLKQLYDQRLRHDVVTDKLQVYEDDIWRELTKKDINTMVCECATLSETNITDREVRCVLNSDSVPSVHPLREYILSLRPYDPNSPVDWIDWLAGQVHVSSSPQDGLTAQRSNSDSGPTGEAGPQTLWKKVFRKWFVAMVASWMSDDVVNQHVLVLIGKQGIYKTTWLERLLPPELRGYGTKLSNLHDLDKDDRLRLAESALINIDEIDALTDRELNQMKSVITASDVNERAAYGYSKERRLRLASFCASGNKREFLTDTTGNRRWLPFEVESIDSPFDNPTVPYKLIYAQAKWLLDNGFNYWFDTDDIRKLEPHTESFHRETGEEQLLSVFYSPATLDDTNAVFRTTAEISATLTWRGNIRHPMSLAALGKLLVQAGFTSKRMAGGGPRGYIVLEKPHNLVADQQVITNIREQENCTAVPDVPDVPDVF